MALAAGAEERAVPEVVPREVFERTGYADVFRGKLVSASAREYFQPAVCYHCYLQLEGRVIHPPVLLTCCGRCRRNESQRGRGRLGEFTMREVVFFGDPGWLRLQREQWMEAVGKLAARSGIESSLEPATDPFFLGGEGRGKKLLQQIKGLKYELRAHMGNGLTLALASFNLHETFFGRHFAIRFPDGEPAASACFAFGLERWALASSENTGRT